MHACHLMWKLDGSQPGSGQSSTQRTCEAAELPGRKTAPSHSAFYLHSSPRHGCSMLALPDSVAVRCQESFEDTAGLKSWGREKGVGR